MVPRPIEAKCHDGVDADSSSVSIYLQDDLASWVRGESIEGRSHPLSAHLLDSHTATHRVDSRRIRLLLVPILDQFLHRYGSIDYRREYRLFFAKVAAGRRRGGDC